MVADITHYEKLFNRRAYDEWTRDEWKIVLSELEITKDTLLTLGEASSFIGHKFELHDGAIKTLLKQMMSAVGNELVVRHPHTDMPYIPTEKRFYYELVRADDLDKWFESQGVEYRLQNNLKNNETLSSNEASIQTSSSVSNSKNLLNEDDEILRFFRSMNSLNYEELCLTFVGEKNDCGMGNNIIEISARGVTKRVTLSGLGLVNMNKGTLNKQGAILLGMSEHQILFKNSSFIKPVSRLREVLRGKLGIKVDPFYKTTKGWKPRFEIFNKIGASDERAKREAESKTISYDESRLYQNIPDEDADEDWLKNNDPEY